MRGRKSPLRFAVVISSVLMVLALVGFVVTLVVKGFFLDDVDAYGEVPIPGSNTVALPAGEVVITFRTQLIGSSGSGGLPIPPLSMNIEPPPGIDDPSVTERIGVSTTINSDARRQVWVVQIVEPGNYTVSADGQVSAYLAPRLAFGNSGSDATWFGIPVATWVWIFVALFVFNLIDVIVLSVLGARRRTSVPGVTLQSPSAYTQPTFHVGESPSYGNAPPQHSSGSFTPTEDGIRIQQLKTLASLRDSGALTQDEFESEKRRLLNN